MAKNGVYTVLVLNQPTTLTALCYYGKPVQGDWEWGEHALLHEGGRDVHFFVRGGMVNGHALQGILNHYSAQNWQKQIKFR